MSGNKMGNLEKNKSISPRSPPKSTNFLSHLENENRKLEAELEQTLARKYDVQSYDEDSLMEPEKSQERVLSANRDIDRLKKKYVSQMQSERSAMKSPAREEDKQLHSMRLRLSGMQKTIRSLEERNRSKTEKIMVLEKELAEQHRRSENLTQKINETSLRSPIPIQPQNTSLRTRDRDLEKRCQDLEQSLGKERKHSLRLAEINSQLLAKLKTIETVNPFQSQLEDMQRENERLQTLCMKLQHSNDNLENECKTLTFQLREIETKTAGYMAAAEEMFRSHERLNSLVNSSSSF